MIIMKLQQNQPSFKGISPFETTLALEENVLLNKAIFDLTSSDIPWVVMANNNEERRERINRSILSFGLIFVSPLLFLPLANRFAMKSIAKLTPELFSKQYNAIRLSNKHLGSAEDTKKGLEELSKDLKIDFNPLVEKVGKDYDKLREKIIAAKNTVLAADIFFIAATIGNVGFFNNWQTRKKTGQKGYSAEMKMADKSIVEKRAEKYEKSGNLRFAGFLGLLAGFTAGMPLAVRHGLLSKNNSKFSNFMKKHAPKFDYTNAIYAKRVPLGASLLVAHMGIVMASRNETELKDNSIRSSSIWSLFFLGDLLMASILGRAADKFLKTKIIKHEDKTNPLHKILPSVKPIKELQKSGSDKSSKVAAAIFWINFVTLSAISGFAMPYLINKIIKKDVAEDVARKNHKM